MIVLNCKDMLTVKNGHIHGPCLLNSLHFWEIQPGLHLASNVRGEVIRGCWLLPLPFQRTTKHVLPVHGSTEGVLYIHHLFIELLRFLLLFLMTLAVNN